jgi:uncharacterized spore protein YtfJ
MYSSLKTVVEQLQSNASVKAVFGEPIYSNDKVIIPVARIAYGFGGGGGAKGNDSNKVQSEPSTHSDRSEGGGGGGGITVIPIGVVEISGGKTRFIRFRKGGLKILGSFLAGFTFAMLFKPGKRTRLIKEAPSAPAS